MGCRIDNAYESLYSAGEVHLIPYGETGTLSPGNYTGQGNVMNVAGTTLNISGLTTVDALSIGGKVNIPSGAILIVNDVLNVGMQGIHNAVTELANWYSLIDFKGDKVLNRGGGTVVCGPILFSHDIDQGSTGLSLIDVTGEAVTNNDLVKYVYGLPDTALVYQYNDNCTPLIAMPVH